MAPNKAVRSIALLIVLLTAITGRAEYFYGGPVNDLAANVNHASTYAVLENMLNVVDIPLELQTKNVTGGEGQIMEEFGAPVAKAFNLAPGPELDTLIISLLQQLADARRDRPQNTLQIAAFERQIKMLQMQQAFYAALVEHSKQSSQPMTYQDRVALQVQLKTLQSQIQLEKQSSQAVSNAALVDAEAQKQEQRRLAIQRAEAERRYTK